LSKTKKVIIDSSQIEELYAHARECSPRECCGLIGGKGNKVTTVYRVENVATDPRTAYEVAPEELFSVQRRMRDKDEKLLGIYHSHPLSNSPVPSETDIRLAFYPSAFYFIIGLKDEPSLCVYSINEQAGSWSRAELVVAADRQGEL
jgi:[CysO sulfur-carrier protein]-S-L-cysteine hydrolase